MFTFKQFFKENYTVIWAKDGESKTHELKVTDDQFSRAYRYLSVNKDAEAEAVKHITEEAGLNEKFAKQIVSIALQHNNPEAFFNALKNKSDITSILNSKNVINFVVEKYGVDRGFAEALLSYQPATQPVSGKGEIFLLLFAKGAKKIVKKRGDTVSGDISIDGVIYEIKGSGAILRGQKGYGTAKAAIAAWDAGLKKLAQKANIQLPQMQSFTIGPKSPGPINNSVPALIASGKVTRDDILNLYIDGFTKLYDAADRDFVHEWLNRSLDQEGKMNAEFLINYYIFAIQYYAMQEDFNYLVSLITIDGAKNNGNVSYISVDQILNNENITDYILPKDYGSITPNVGVQSSWIGIKPANA